MESIGRSFVGLYREQLHVGPPTVACFNHSQEWPLHLADIGRRAGVPILQEGDACTEGVERREDRPPIRRELHQCPQAGDPSVSVERPERRGSVVHEHEVVRDQRAQFVPIVLTKRGRRAAMNGEHARVLPSLACDESVVELGAG